MLPAATVVVPLMVLVPVRVRVDPAGKFMAPLPLMALAKVWLVPLRLRLSVPLLTMAPPTLPLVPPLPSVKVPALMVVVPFKLKSLLTVKLPPPALVRLAPVPRICAPRVLAAVWVSVRVPALASVTSALRVSAAPVMLSAESAAVPPTAPDRVTLPVPAETLRLRAVLSESMVLLKVMGWLVLDTVALPARVTGPPKVSAPVALSVPPRVVALARDRPPVMLSVPAVCCRAPMVSPLAPTVSVPPDWISVPLPRFNPAMVVDSAADGL